MTTNLDKINHYDPDKIYKFEFTEKEISTIENAIERHIQHQEEDVPQELQKRWEDHFLMEEKKLLKKFYDVSDQVDDAWHEQVDNDILHESLNDQMKKIIGEN
tara:strand:+ start:302 stop:610 length:309 start_codon:yes stop_codon:yes gene_type:complete